MKKSIDILLNNVGHLSLTKSHIKLERLGLYKGQPPLLEILFEEDGRTQKEIVERLKVSRATVSKMVARMEKRGLLRLVEDPEDLRSIRVYLTDEAKNLESELRILNLEMKELILQNFSDEEEELLRKLLLKVEKNLS